MKNLAIIPARSGSKGLKDKNIKELNGKPLIAYSIEAALEADIFDEIMVSTDSEKYAQIARQYGAQVPFLRSDDLATDLTDSWEVVENVLNNYIAIGKKFDTVTLLQPTSPLRTDNEIREAMNLFINNQADSVVSITAIEHPIQWSLSLEDNKRIHFREPENSTKRRQELKMFYRENGAIYIVMANKILHGQSIYSGRCLGYAMQSDKSIDIDSKMDFRLAEVYLNQWGK